MRGADAKEQAEDGAAGRGAGAGFRPQPGRRFPLSRLPRNGGEPGEEGIQRWGAAIGGLGGEGWLSELAGATRRVANFPGEGVFPGEGAFSARKSCRRRVLRLQAAAGSARPARKVILFIYLLAFSLLGWT